MTPGRKLRVNPQNRQRGVFLESRAAPHQSRITQVDTHIRQRTGTQRRAIALAAVMTLSVVGSAVMPALDGGALAKRDSAQLTQGFANSTAIAIKDIQQATPSSIFVGGFDTPVADVNVTLFGLSHTQVNDIDILLVGPQGQSALLVSDVGSSANNVTLALDDQAAGQINSAGPMTSGSFQPTNFHTPDEFFPPAPASPKGARLAVFNSTDPNGEWKLFIEDDVINNTGTLAGGWSMTITSANGVPNAEPDRNTVRAGQTVTDQGGVLANDRDPDDDSLTAVLAGEPAKGRSRCGQMAPTPTAQTGRPGGRTRSPTWRRTRADSATWRPSPSRSPRARRSASSACTSSIVRFRHDFAQRRTTPLCLGRA